MRCHMAPFAGPAASAVSASRLLDMPFCRGSPYTLAGSRQSGYNSVVMVAHTVPGALLILEPTDTGVQPWG